MSELRLNLASGSDNRVGNGWRNLDIVEKWPNCERSADEIWDARSDKIPYPDCSVDEIYAGYLLLHVSRPHHVPLMAECFRVLQPGGKITIDEVNMKLAMQRWIENPRDESANTIVWGENGSIHGAQFEEYDTHRSGHTLATLMQLMQDAGFTRVSRVQIHDPVAVWYSLSLTGIKP